MEPFIYQQIPPHLLPKDYIRYRLTGDLPPIKPAAAGTLWFDIEQREWSPENVNLLEIGTGMAGRKPLKALKLPALSHELQRRM